MQNIVLVFLGGGLGSVSRYGISIFFTEMWQNKLSATAATLTSNVISCLLLILVWTLIDLGKLPQNLKYLLIVGFCGGFSTFSTFSFETFQLLREGLFALALINILLSVGLCVGLLFATFKQLT